MCWRFVDLDPKFVCNNGRVLRKRTWNVTWITVCSECEGVKCFMLVSVVSSMWNVTWITVCSECEGVKCFMLVSVVSSMWNVTWITVCSECEGVYFMLVSVVSKKLFYTRSSFAYVCLFIF